VIATLARNQTGFNRLKVAAISMKPEKWDKDSNAAKMEMLFRKAADRRAKVAVITEGALEGYVVMDAIKRPELRSKLLEISEPRDGPSIKRFMNLAKSLEMCLCLGFAARAGNEVYNAALFIDHNGIIRGGHHKMQFAEGLSPILVLQQVGKTNSLVRYSFWESRFSDL
jgi:predicted amidohydrolase